MSIILGIDPGSRITGFGLIQVEGKTPNYVASGCIRVKHTQTADRLLEIADGIGEVIERYRPVESAIERIFMFYSADSALKLGQARGVAMVALAQQELMVAEYTAKQIKQAVVGYGGADKTQVQHMVKQLLNLSAVPQADGADALAIALCHCHTKQSLHQLTGIKKTVRRRWQ